MSLPIAEGGNGCSLGSFPTQTVLHQGFLIFSDLAKFSTQLCPTSHNFSQNGPHTGPAHFQHKVHSCILNPPPRHLFYSHSHSLPATTSKEQRGSRAIIPNSCLLPACQRRRRGCSSPLPGFGRTLCPAGSGRLGARDGTGGDAAHHPYGDLGTSR